MVLSSYGGSPLVYSYNWDGNADMRKHQWRRPRRTC